MPNGGESGRQLDRLQDQVDATRAELGEVAGAVNGLRELVTELVRRSGSEHQAERWQARLGSLETRLEMMETAIRSEVERVRAAAGSVDALADEFRTTVGDTQSLVGLAVEIGNRLDVLQNLEREVRGAAHDVAASVSERLDREASGRGERDRALVDRITDTINESRAAVSELADRLDAIARATDELPSTQNSLAQAISGVSGDLSRLRTDLEATNESGRRATVDALGVLSTELAAFESRLSSASSNDTRLEEILSAVAQVRAQHPQLNDRLDHVSTELGVVQERLAQPLVSFEPISERLDALSASLRSVITSQPDHRPELEQLGHAIAELRDAQPDHGPQFDQLGHAIAELREAQPDHGPRFDQLGHAIAELRDAQPDYGEALQRLIAIVTALPSEHVDPTDALARVAMELAELRATQPDPTEALQRLTAVVAALRTEQVDPTASLERLASELAELRANQPDPNQLVELLAEQAAAVAELRASPPDVHVDLDPLAQRIDALSAGVEQRLADLRARPEPTLDLEPVLTRIDDALGQLAQVRASQPVTDAVVARLASTLNEQSEALSQLRSGQPQLTVRLDQLAADLAELSDRQQALAFNPERFDQLSADLVQRVQAAQPELEVRLERVQAELADLRSRLPDTDAALAPIAERLDRVAEDVSRLHETGPAVARLGDQLDQLRAAQADPAVAQNFFAERLDRVLAEVAALRADAPDAQAAADAVAPLVRRLDEVSAALATFRDEVRTRPAPVVDLDGALQPLHERVAALDARSATTNDGIAQFEGRLARTSMQLEELTASIAALRDAPNDTSGALAPIVDRLAVVVDTVSSMHGDVAGLAEAFATVRADRAQLSQLAGDTNSRLDVLAAGLLEVRDARPDLSPTNEHVQQLANAVAELRESRPDFTSSFGALTDLVDSLQAGVTETRNRIDALHEGLQTSDVRAEMAAVVDPVIDRLDGIAARAAITETQIGTTLDDLAESVTRFDSEQAVTLRTHIDELRQAVHALGDRQANALMDVVQRFEQVSANAAATQDAIRAIDTALAAPRDDSADERLGDLAQQVATLAADVRSSVRSIVGLGSDLTALRTDVETLTVAMPDASDSEAGMRAALTNLDSTLADRDRQMREMVERLDREVATRDEDLSEAFTRLHDAMTSSARPPDLTSVTTTIEASIAGLERVLSERNPEEAVQAVSTAVRDVRADLQSTRTELQSISRTVGELRSELRRPDDMAGGAGAALVASAATAMARLEARMDGEFDSVGRQMEALGTLLGQVIDSVHRVEAQVIGVHPMSERVRSSAASVLDSLRTNVRQRAAHRQGPPPELGSGPSY